MDDAFPGPGSAIESTTISRSGSITESQLGPSTQGANGGQAGSRLALATKTRPRVTAMAVGVCPTAMLAVSPWRMLSRVTRLANGFAIYAMESFTKAAPAAPAPAARLNTSTDWGAPRSTSATVLPAPLVTRPWEPRAARANGVPPIGPRFTVTGEFGLESGRMVMVASPALSTTRCSSGVGGEGVVAAQPAASSTPIAVLAACLTIGPVRRAVMPQE